MSEAPRWRRGVGIMLLDPGSRVFVGRRIDFARRLADAARRHRRAARRRVRRRCANSRRRPASTAAEIIAEARAWLRYELPPELQRHRLWGGLYRGQEQKWFAMRFTGNEAEIDLATHHPEFDAWKWVRRRNCRPSSSPSSARFTRRCCGN